jgi:hypothetical protein
MCTEMWQGPAPNFTNSGIKTEILYGVTLCSLGAGRQCFQGTWCHYLQDLLKNTDIFLPDYTVSKLRIAWLIFTAVTTLIFRTWRFILPKSAMLCAVHDNKSYFSKPQTSFPDTQRNLKNTRSFHTKSNSQEKQ